MKMIDTYCVVTSEDEQLSFEISGDCLALTVTETWPVRDEGRARVVLDSNEAVKVRDALTRFIETGAL